VKYLSQGNLSSSRYRNRMQESCCRYTKLLITSDGRCLTNSKR